MRVIRDYKLLKLAGLLLVGSGLIGLYCTEAKAQDRSINGGAQAAFSLGDDVQAKPTYGGFAQLNWKIDPCVAPGCNWTPRGEARIKIGHTVKIVDGNLLTYSFGNLFLQPVFHANKFRLSIAAGIGRSYAYAYDPHSRWKKGLTTIPVGLRADIGTDHHFGANYIFVREDDKLYPNHPKSMEAMYRFTGPINKKGLRYFFEAQYTRSKFTSVFYPGVKFQDSAITMLMGIGRHYHRDRD